MLLLPYLDFRPSVHASVIAGPATAVIGRAHVGAGTVLSNHAVLRADGEEVRVGANGWLGPATTAHIADRRSAMIAGDGVTVGRYGLLHACTLADDCVVGENASVMDATVVGAGAVIAADSVVPPGKTLEGGWLYAGIPARPVAKLDAARLAHLHRALRTNARIDADCVFSRAAVPSLRLAPGTGTFPPWPAGSYVAPNASLAGNVVLAARASVWLSCELDAGDAKISIGAATAVQDNTRIYTAGGRDVRIGARVVIGHNVQLFDCTIEDDAIVGMGATVSPGTIVRSGGCVAAGSITEPASEIRSGQIYSGRPARGGKALSDAQRQGFDAAVEVYVLYSRNYAAAVGRS